MRNGQPRGQSEVNLEQDMKKTTLLRLLAKLCCNVSPSSHYIYLVLECPLGTKKEHNCCPHAPFDVGVINLISSTVSHATHGVVCLFSEMKKFPPPRQLYFHVDFFIGGGLVVRGACHPRQGAHGSVCSQLNIHWLVYGHSPTFLPVIVPYEWEKGKKWRDIQCVCCYYPL